MQTIKGKVNALLRWHRDSNTRQLNMINSSEGILLKLPAEILEKCCFSSAWLQISSPSRGETLVILETLRAGKWEKSPSQAVTKIDYEGVVDGVRIIIFAAEAPPTCQIIETEVYVPAHNVTKRELVCH